jgi:hypothetical protein
MEQYGWAIGVGIILVALSLSKAVPALVRAFADRVAELEERVDFAERLLAKQREADHLAKPPS